ncbi:Aste57867_15082 [Aphanomyces stellatus]|uniref:Aste57867_15082 protein n=1 Tax=Aphanomyces stellatus TaxID=120398 RepID=A0A485L3K7_9STRA|nr:hypothetical protein As57867_015026 [Aphanomyces stellatus]VFT91895.1 Aste57867_15082 [Aphanomyces stellatus]
MSEKVTETSAAPSELSCDEKKAMGTLSSREPLRIRFFYLEKMVDALLKMPLTMEPVESDKGTQCIHLELWLKDQFGIPQDESVFAIVPVLEPYSPALPLILLNTIVHRLVQELGLDAPLPVLDYALVVRPMSSLRVPIPPSTDESSPFYAVDGIALASKEASFECQAARVHFVTKMKTYGFARIAVSRERAQIPQDAWEKVRTWLAQQLALPRLERWGERVDESEPVSNEEDIVETNDPTDEDDDTTPRSLSSLVCFWRPPATPSSTKPLAKKLTVSKGRYVGFSCDKNREYLQLRQPLRSAGTVWPRPYFAATQDGAAFATDMLALLHVLDDVGRDCMEAICDVLAIDRKWIFDELLDDTAPPPATPDDVTTTHDRCRYGASVLRVYNYRNKKGALLDTPARIDINMSCGSHADLGLVTVSPTATVPGLQMWNLERMLWTDVENDAGELHFSVFAGETLGYITNGLIQAPLHRVPATVVDDEAQRRMSMPYFLRARPEACLNPTRPKDAPPLTVRDFMEEVVFKTRPWRRDTCATPDY